MISYIFILGNSTELCLAELEAILQQRNIIYQKTFIQFPVVIIETELELPVQELINQLGGTIKIAKAITSLISLSPDILSLIIEKNLQQLKTFGFSIYNSESINLQKLSVEIKQIISDKLSHIRYIVQRQDKVLSSVVVQKQHVQEFILVFDKKNSKWILGLTQVVTNADEWSKRDMGRPCIDSKSGMLPLKVARMMVNLASSQLKIHLPNRQADSSQHLLDPFCGMGSILAEALILGWYVIGSDYSPEVIRSTQKNLEWLTSVDTNITKLKFNLVTSDATHVSEIPGLIKENMFDAIVTEPFMGAVFELKKGQVILKNKPVTVNAIKNQIKGLEKLYLGALKDWYKILKAEAIVVIVLPEIEWNRQAFFVKKVVDSCEKLGYTLVQGPFYYNRPQAVVKRKIYIFQKSEIRNPKLEINSKQ